ncbi:helix-turn-helix domain-containing protein [Moorena sp. SIO3H5]|uniref:helix-turn-helix domain-containing protein n=1 Tax=Moorena sp. SIO3H5 TaxID=2607834 RepID=UPI0013B7A133|nr:helix-turn-helix domain-containing protein [Moorena sp. SIO3H5]NEO74665.1 helix-turn-helix domain-containing protein [Moorena sp. SIO3H5]
MSRPFKIEIAQSEEELKKLLQTARVGNQKEKLQMLWWLKSGQVKEQQEIGKRLARDSSTVTRWLQKYRSGGLSGLLEIKKAAGAKRKINDHAIAALIQELKTGKGFSSYGAIVEWLKKEHGLDIEYGTVYALVRYRLGAKLKVPRPQSYKQDEKLVSEFKKNSVSFSIVSKNI